MTLTLLPAEHLGTIARHAMPSISGPIIGENSALNSAREHALVPPSVEELARIREDARLHGHAEGLAKGYAESAQRVQQQVRRLQQICDQLAAPLATVDDAVIDVVGELAVTIARHLVRRELRHSPGEVVGVVRESMRQLPLATRRARIHLHPDDLVLVQEALAIRADTAWELEADPLITRGGCVVETETSRVDAQVESRIAAIASRMFGDERGADRAG